MTLGKRFQARSQHLPPLSERRTGHFFQLVEMGKDFFRRQRVQNGYGAVHFRRGSERTRRQREGNMGIGNRMGQDGEATILIRIRFGAHALSHFLLEHQGHLATPGA